MIKVTIIKDLEKEYKAVQVLGHAGFSKKGTDIICAAVSVLFINTMNAIESLTEDRDCCEIAQREEEGYLQCRFHGKLSKESILLLDAMVLGITSIQEQYSKKYIELRFEEV